MYQDHPPSIGFHGFYFTTRKEEHLFFGIWFDYWEMEGKLVCITLEEADDNIISKFYDVVAKLELPSNLIFQEQPITYLIERDFTEKDSQRKITTRLKQIADKIGVQKIVVGNGRDSTLET
ncbi:MAG: hypothetical protein IPN54_02370 [Bacteroidetes bacterium]|nr:hypothetical protein [Bacteroidota bacterium]